MKEIEFEIEETKIIEDGKHAGEIIDVEYREAPYKYVDIIVDIEGFNIKMGFPARITNKSEFGNFLANMGFPMKTGKKVTLSEIKEFLVGQHIECLTYTDDDGFIKIMKETVHKR